MPDNKYANIQSDSGYWWVVIFVEHNNHFMPFIAAGPAFDSPVVAGEYRESILAQHPGLIIAVVGVDPH